jgi:hypothetical protein
MAQPDPLVRGHARPVELLDQVTFDTADPNHLLLGYQHGGHGLFVSDDAGRTLKWLCSTGIHTTASMRNGLLMVIGGGGELYVGMFDGLLKGDSLGCGFAPVPELDKQFIKAIVPDIRLMPNAPMSWLPLRTPKTACS